MRSALHKMIGLKIPGTVERSILFNWTAMKQFHQSRHLHNLPQQLESSRALNSVAPGLLQQEQLDFLRVLSQVQAVESRPFILTIEGSPNALRLNPDQLLEALTVLLHSMAPSPKASSPSGTQHLQ